MFSRKENSKTVGIFEGKEKRVFVHCATDIIIDHSLEVKDDGEWCVYCLTKKGDVYRVGKDQADQCARKSSRHESEQIEIFSDLLGQGNSNDEIQLTLSSQPVYILEEGDIVHRRLEDPIRLCVSTNYTVVLARQTEEYVVHVFEKTGKGTVSGERIARLPKKCSENMNNSLCEILIKVVTCPCIGNSESACPCDLGIDTVLFKQLFGEDTALLTSPVVLICMGDGSVYFMRMSSFDSRGSVDSSPLIARNNSWTLLCHMSSSVEEVAVVNVLDNKVNSYATALCVCCKDGQVTIFLSEKNHLDCSIWDVFITSPVVSICSFRNRLYYISGHSLFESTVVMDCESIQSPRNIQLHISQTKMLGEKYLAKIHTAFADRYVDSQDSPCVLHCSCQNGEVKLIETSLMMDSNTESSVFFKESLKHILTSIDCVDEKRHKIKNERKIQEETLKQLSIASYLMTMHKDQQRKRLTDSESINTEGRNGVNEPSVSKVLSILVQIGTHTNDESELTEVNVEVTNNMPVVLSSVWTVSASLYNTVDGSVCVSTAVKNESNWKHQEKKILSLPVTFDDILVGCKLLVKATLILDNLVSETLSDKGTDDSVCVSCPLFEGDIDVLDCLLPSSMKTNLDGHVPQSTSKLISHIRKQAYDRNRKLKLLSVKSGFDDVTVHTRHKIRYSMSKTEGKTSEAEFKFLREVHGSIPVEINDIQTSNYKLFTPVGHSIHFGILPVPGDSTGKGTCGEVLENSFEVTVRSTQRNAAAVNRAIRRRETRIINTLRNHVAPEIKTNNAKKAIHAAQELLNQLRCKQINQATLTSAFQNLRNIQL